MQRQRDERGRFVKGHSISVGNKGGPGRPPRKREEKYLERFRKAVTLQEFQEAAQALVRVAKSGDVPAIRLLFSYALGNPKQLIEADITQRSLGADLLMVIEKVYGDTGEDG